MGDKSGDSNQITSAPAGGEEPESYCLTLETRAHTAVLRGRKIALTPKEYAVLDVLVRARGRSVSIEDMLDQAWGQKDGRLTGKVRIVVARLRRRLGNGGLIETIGGQGYRLVSAAELGHR